MKLNHPLFAQLRDTAKHLMSRGPVAATAAIQEALKNAGSQPVADYAQGAANLRDMHDMHDINPPPPPPPSTSPQPAVTPKTATPFVATFKARAPAAETAARPDLQSEAKLESKVNAEPDLASSLPMAAQAFAQDLMARLGRTKLSGAQTLDLNAFDLPGFGMPAPAPHAEPEIAPGAQFIAGAYRNHAGSRNYKLYIPSSWHGQAMPLLVMLHGCTQNPDDFATGTRMNAVAEEKQCFVVYPAQSKGANSSKCWNWFNALDQQRDQGEPSIIAGIAQKISAEYGIDQSQVFVAGLSAGGAMAVIVGTLYPDVFAAVGVHSGLPFASAQDLPSALAAMRSGAASLQQPSHPAKAIPIIVFHGDRDTTVHPRNGEQLMAQGLHSGATQAPSVQSGTVPNGHSYTHTTHARQNGAPLAEHWVIHGAGHAWSGGSAHGSYTDHKGPDASREMMRFFKTLA